MNDKELAAVKQAKTVLSNVLEYGGMVAGIDEAVADLEQVISQDALYKMAEDAVTIGLSYNDWPKIGCVNHDCDHCKAAQPAPVQEPSSRVDAVVAKIKAGIAEKPTALNSYGLKLWDSVRDDLLALATPPEAKPAIVREPVSQEDQSNRCPQCRQLTLCAQCKALR